MDEKDADNIDETQQNRTKKSNRLGSWFHSLTRQKSRNKSNKKQPIVECNSLEHVTGDLDNNVEPTTAAKENLSHINVFHKFKMDFKFALKSPTNCKILRTEKEICAKQSNEPELNRINNENCNNDEFYEQQINALEEKPFTYSYRCQIKKKWLDPDSGPNLIMYRACSEMLERVWYWGATRKQDAQKQLTGKPNGSFLVRDSESEGSQFTLSFRICNCTLHYRLQHRDNYWYFEETSKFHSIVDMFEDIMNRSTDEHFVCYVRAHNIMQPPIPVYLRYPISRYINIPTLQDLCRRSIQHIGIKPDEMQNLPIPIKLQQYLTEKNSIVF